MRWLNAANEDVGQAIVRIYICITNKVDASIFHTLGGRLLALMLHYPAPLGLLRKNEFKCQTPKPKRTNLRINQARPDASLQASTTTNASRVFYHGQAQKRRRVRKTKQKSLHA
jgi:hypothetical protein